MTTLPTVSVCVPVYNAERFVAEAVRSALSQTYSDLEVLVVDNASTDSTANILSAFKDPRLCLFRNPENIGAARNFNRAVSLARGRYVKVLCADDVLYPQCLEKQVAVLEADHSGRIALVACARDIIDERGRPRLRRSFRSGATRIDGSSAVRMTVRRGTNVFGEPAAVLARTEAVRRVGAFNPDYSFCLDLDLWCRLLRTGDLYVLSEALCGFRVYRQSWSAALSARQHTEFGRFVEDLHANGVSVSVGDRLRGRARARVNALARRLFTRVVMSGAATE